MPYYRAGDYYRGDYYRGNYAAGGIFGTIGKALKKVAGAALSLTPAGKAIKFLAPVVSGTVSGLLSRRALAPPTGPAGPGFNFGPGGEFESFGGGPFGGGSAGGMLGGRRRRLDPLNVKALRRAGRRLKGFLRIARRLGALPVAGGKGKRVFKVARRRK